MQLTEKQREYWRKNLRITGDPAGHLVPRDVRHGLLRPRPGVQFLRLAVQLLHGRAGLADRLRGHHLVLRALHEQARPRVRRRTKGRTNNGRHSCSTTARHRQAHILAGTSREFTRSSRRSTPGTRAASSSSSIVLAIARAAGAAAAAGSATSSCWPPSACTPASAIMSRTTDAAEYYVAGRRVPALFNGMATGADWMSAASFIGMAGTLYLTASTAWRSSWAGPAAIAWWRCSSRPTCASSASSRFPTSSARATAATFRASIGIFAAILCSFTYVVAQIYGVGLITTRLDRRGFELGHLRRSGRHSGVLVPGRHARGDLDAGGAVHHPDRRLHDPGGLAVGEADRHPGAAGRLRLAAEKVTGARRELHQGSEGNRGPRHLQGARRRSCGEKLKDIARRTPTDKAAARRGRREAEGGERTAPKCSPRPRRRSPRFPQDATAAKAAWTKDARRSPRARRRRCAMPRRSPARTSAARDMSRRNFLALVFCLMVGTAALPHILMRYYTTPSVRRRANRCPGRCSSSSCCTSPRRRSAVLVKFDVYTLLVGPSSRKLPRLGGGLDQGRSVAAVGRRHQQGRHPAARRDHDRRRHHRAGDARDRRVAVRGLGPGRRRRPGGGAVDRRRPAADDRQRAVARPVLQDDRPERVRPRAA